MSDKTRFLAALDELIECSEQHWNDIYIESSGLWQGKPWNSPQGLMSSFEMSFILEGSAVLHMNNREYEAGKGCFYFSDLSLHSSCAQSDLKMFYITFNTHTPELRRIFRSSFAHLAECPQSIASSGLEDCFSDFHYENSIKRPYNRLSAKLAFLKILISCYRSLTNFGDSESHIPLGNRQHKLVGEIIKYLDEHYHENLELRDIAAAYSLNPRYVNSLFKKITGSTITQHLISLRTKKAKRLLKFTDMSITDIALDTG
jgi:AraC-like DNA-binding protein